LNSVVFASGSTFFGGRGGNGVSDGVPPPQCTTAYQYPTGGEGPAKIWTVLDPDGLGPLGFGKPTLRTTTNVGGFDFIPAQERRSVDSEANLAWDRSGSLHNGRLYTIWTSEIPDESNNTDIMFQFTDDAGAHWSTPVRLNDDSGTNSQFNPAIAIDQSSGAIGVSWYGAQRPRTWGLGRHERRAERRCSDLGHCLARRRSDLRSECAAQRRDVELRGCSERHRLR
jgi:hypothetical protein